MGVVTSKLYHEDDDWKTRCTGPGKKVFVVTNVIIFLLLIFFTFYSFYLLGAFDLTGPVLALLLPAMLFQCAIVPVPIYGVLGLKRKTNDALIAYSILFTVIILFYTSVLLFFNIMSGGTDYFPPIGNNFGRMKSNFDAQVFNRCCVSFLDNQDTVSFVRSCSQIAENSQEPCVNAELSFNNMVTNSLCKDLVKNERKTFVGNNLTDSCGGVLFDFNLFQPRFRSFYEPFLSGYCVVFSLVLILMGLTCGVGVTQSCFFKPATTWRTVFKQSQGSVQVVSIPAKLTRFQPQTYEHPNNPFNKPPTRYDFEEIKTPPPLPSTHKPLPPTPKQMSRTENVMFEPPGL